jgi:hypothetical protein
LLPFSQIMPMKAAARAMIETECGLVCVGRPAEAANLADKLQGAGADFVIWGWRFEAMQRLDAPAD